MLCRQNENYAPVLARDVYVDFLCNSPVVGISLLQK